MKHIFYEENAEYWMRSHQKIYCQKHSTRVEPTLVKNMQPPSHLYLNRLDSGWLEWKSFDRLGPWGPLASQQVGFSQVLVSLNTRFIIFRVSQILSVQVLLLVKTPWPQVTEHWLHSVHCVNGSQRFRGGQCFVSEALPLHLLDSEHFRVLVTTPDPPQVTEHLPQLPHSDHFAEMAQM